LDGSAAEAAGAEGDGTDMGLVLLYSLEADGTAQAASEDPTAAQAVFGNAAQGTGIFNNLLNKK